MNRDEDPPGRHGGCDYLSFPAEIMHDGTGVSCFKTETGRWGSGAGPAIIFPGKTQADRERQERKRALNMLMHCRGRQPGGFLWFSEAGRQVRIPDGISYEAGYGQIVGLLRILSPVAGFMA